MVERLPASSSVSSARRSRTPKRGPVDGSCDPGTAGAF
jgi:hypothetical protein